MRHRDIATTMRYYVSLETDDVSAQLWGGFDDPGNKSRNIRPETTESKNETRDVTADSETTYRGQSW